MQPCPEKATRTRGSKGPVRAPEQRTAPASILLPGFLRVAFLVFALCSGTTLLCQYPPSLALLRMCFSIRPGGCPPPPTAEDSSPVRFPVKTAFVVLLICLRLCLVGHSIDRAKSPACEYPLRFSTQRPSRQYLPLFCSKVRSKEGYYSVSVYCCLLVSRPIFSCGSSRAFRGLYKPRDAGSKNYTLLVTGGKSLSRSEFAQVPAKYNHTVDKG